MFPPWRICASCSTVTRHATARSARLWRISASARRRKRDKPETHLRLGVGEVLLGRYASGLDHLKKAGEVGMALFFQGLAHENLQKYDEAAKAFAHAAKLGYDPKNSELHRAGLSAAPAMWTRPRSYSAGCRS